MEELQVLDQKTSHSIFKPYAAKFKALADEKRLQIMFELCQRGKTCVCDLQDVLNLPQSSLSYHLKILVEAGLILRETQGTWSYYELNPDEVHALLSEPLCCIFQSDIVTTLRAAGCVFAEDEAQLLISSAQTPADLATMVDQRVAGLPLEHVLGWAEFCGLRIIVDSGVFVPRRRTEFLVHQAASLARTRSRSIIVDLCCGSGAVGAALLADLDQIELYAADIDPAAVRCARRNVDPARGHVYEGDLYEPLPATLKGRVDVLVANTPYVPTEAIERMPQEARVHEPLVALDGGSDGLDVQRRVAATAAFWLAPGGHLLVETSKHQAALASEIFTHSGLISRVVRSDELDATVVIGTKPTL